jgi:hypothetical protein
LYEVFAGYPLGDMHHVCDCGCVSEDDQARIRSKPLRQLTPADLGRYTFKATTTWGTADDLRHFLPRILEIVAYTGQVDYVDPEIAFGKLDHAGWTTWPVHERQAIEAFFAALWRRMLLTRATVETWAPLPWRADDCLCAIGQVVDDLTPYLDVWTDSRHLRVIHHLAVCVLDNFDDLALEGRLGNAFWEGREVQMGQIKRWLLGGVPRAALQDGLARFGSAPEAAELALAVDRLGRVAASFERASGKHRGSVSGTLFDATYPLPVRWLFVTVSGAHLYGFPSADSDYDLRGAHVLPASELLRLDDPDETLESKTEHNGVHVELVTHDVKKYFRLLLNRNGYVLEQIFSPLVVATSREYEELRTIARACVTRRHAEHYLGFADQQWRLATRKGPTVKALLYLYRVLLTGIHLMHTGEVEANLLRLNEEFRLPQLPEMIERKVSGHEAETASSAELTFHTQEYDRLRRALREAGAASRLPDAPSGREALNDLLLRLRAA